jgi:23S rRNA pseudouridine2605 synthase
VADPAPRLQKWLADRGFGSRRELEAWIRAGRVKVNGRVAELGLRVAERDRVTVDGKPVRAPTRAPRSRVIAMNKPVGVVCTRSDPEGRATVFDQLPRLGQGRWIGVGRLDIQTSGLLLLTNDGALAHRMMHPSTGLDREYAVRVRGRLEDEALASLREGVTIEGELHRFSDIQYYDGSGANHWYHVVLLEGRNREVRKRFESVGGVVSRLKRVRYGPVMLPSRLASGRTQALSFDDLKELYRLLKLPLNATPERTAERVKSLLIPYPEPGSP